MLIECGRNKIHQGMVLSVSLQFLNSIQPPKTDTNLGKLVWNGRPIKNLKGSDSLER